MQLQTNLVGRKYINLGGVHRNFNELGEKLIKKKKASFGLRETVPQKK